MLDGKRATTHWGLADILGERYPKVRWQPEQFVTEDGRLFCSGGVYTAIDLSLVWSKNSAVTKSHFSAPNRSCSACHAGRQSGYSVVQLSRPHSDEKIRQSEEYLQQHFDRDISIDILARQAGMGPRNFIRRFKAATGRVPGAYSRHSKSRPQRKCSNTASRQDSGRQLENRLRRYRVLPQSVQASHRHDARVCGISRQISQMSFERGALTSGRQ